MRFNLFKKRNTNLLEEVFSDISLHSRDVNYSTSKLESRLVGSNMYLIIAFTCVLFSIFIYRLFDLQYLNYDIYLKKSDNNQFVTIPILPTRGSILDRNGVVLVKSTEGKDTDSEFSKRREYTEAEGLSHILGYVTYPKKDKSGVYYQNNFEGVTGLEKYYDQLLGGRPGKRVFEKDVGMQSQNGFVTELPVEGKDIKISIDSELQSYAYKELKKFVIEKDFKAGTIIIMDSETGEILVMTNYPEYKIQKMIPEEAVFQNWSATETKKYIQDINKDKNTPLLNRAVSGTYAPGSTMKPAFALAALQEELVDAATSIFSSGKIEVPNTVDPTKITIFRDWKAHGWVNVRTALANSSDVYFYAVGGGYENQKGLGIDRLVNYSKAFGIDSPTGIDLPSESVGNIPSPSWKQKVFKESWRLGDTYNSSIGQFGYLTTPIGMLRYTNAVARNGILVTPKLRLDDNPRVESKVTKAILPEYYKIVQEGMRMTITSGTAKTLNSKVVEVAGKSGTAEVGVKKDKIQSWIAGYFPYKEPKYAFVFLCELGIRDKSPTPNVLARKVIEKMYFMPEYNEKLGGTGAIEDSVLYEDMGTTTPVRDELRSR